MSESSESLDRNATRSEVRKIIQLMNQYDLLEFEYEEQDGDRAIELSRSSSDSFPPLLEGRSQDVPGKLRAPAVGALQWDVEDGADVAKGDVLGAIEAHDAVEEIVADRSGILVDPVEASHVEYGQHLGSIVAESELPDSGEEEQNEEVDESEEDPE